MDFGPKNLIFGPKISFFPMLWPYIALILPQTDLTQWDHNLGDPSKKQHPNLKHKAVDRGGEGIFFKKVGCFLLIFGHISEGC